MSAVPNSPITVAEYLAGERVAQEKHEYWNGQVYALAGGSRNHNLNDTLLNPTIIIEVLSPSTEHYDRGGKFQQYRRIASLREYLLIDQFTYHIEQYVRQADHQWLLIELDGVDVTVTLSAIGCTLTAGAIYAKVGLNED